MTETTSDAAPERPTTDDPESWHTYWQTQNMPWRTELEISAERQIYLAERRAIIPNIRQGIYPFKNIEPALTRADIEWLLATHDSGRGPVVWDVELHAHEDMRRTGLDLRGADLRYLYLADLPLAQTRGGLIYAEWLRATGAQREQAQIHLEDADLSNAHLEGAVLHWAHMERANFSAAHLENSRLVRAQLTGANLSGAHLQGADLRLVFFDSATGLINVTLGSTQSGFARLADARWGGANLTVINWKPMMKGGLGDELAAWRWQADKKTTGVLKDPSTGREQWQAGQLDTFKAAVRATRQVATELRNQGLYEESNQLAYRAQILQRSVYRYEGEALAYLCSLLLAALAGYGYRFRNIIAVCLTTVALFATAYAISGWFVGEELSLQQIAYAAQISLNAIHGRVFFAQFGLDTFQSWLATTESVFGIIIEGIFVAILIQRFFGK